MSLPRNAFLAAGLAAAAALAGARAGRHQRRRDGVGHRPGRVARHPGEEHDRADAADDRRPEGQLHRARRRLRHDDGGRQHAQADHREQGRRHARLDDHAELAGDDRRRRRGADADDLDGRLGRASSSRSTPSASWVFKTPQNDIMMSLAIADAHGRRRRQDGRLHRLLRRLRRRLVPASSARPPPLKGLTIVANERYARTDTSVTGQVLKLVAAKPDAVLVAGSGTPAALPQTHAEGARLRRQVLPDARRRQHRLPARRRQGRRRHLPAGGPGAGRGAAAGDATRCKPSALDYVAKYEAAYGKGSVSTFGAPRLGRRPADGGRRRRWR